MAADRSKAVGLLTLAVLVLWPWGRGEAHTAQEREFYEQSRTVLQREPGNAVAGTAVGTW